MFEQMSELKDGVDQAATLITDVVRLNNRLFLAGNGGSASDEQHLAAEVVDRFNYDCYPLLAIAPNTDHLC
jgi:D-sedoheptulose 7-phosphate isomerase